MILGEILNNVHLNVLIEVWLFIYDMVPTLIIALKKNLVFL